MILTMLIDVKKHEVAHIYDQTLTYTLIWAIAIKFGTKCDTKHDTKHDTNHAACVMFSSHVKINTE